MTPTELRAFRESLGLDVKSFAQALGVEPRTVRRWEDGSRSPDKFVLFKMETIFGVSVGLR